MTELDQQFRKYKLEIYPEKTKIVYCKDGNRKEAYTGNTSFVFLGYEFRVRGAENKKTKEIFGSFLPAISPKAEKAITERIRELNVRNKSELNLNQIAKWLNPMIQGWINYYGRYTKSALNRVFQRLNRTLTVWSMRKYKKLAKRKTYAAKYMARASPFDHLKQTLH